MNERIKELREQAADFAGETYSKYTMATFDTNKSIETLFEEKFAELIIAECMKAAKNADLRRVTYTTFDRDRMEYCKSKIAESIEEHFK